MCSAHAKLQPPESRHSDLGATSIAVGGHEDFAATLVRHVSPAAGYGTGRTIVVDGGLTII